MTISDALHRLLLDNLTTATILLDAELRLEYMNPAAEMLPGHQRPAQPRAVHQRAVHRVHRGC